MNIPTPNDLKAMMKDLEQRKKALTKHFDTFEQLQSDIQTLNQRASKGDASSIKKITHFANAFPNGLAQQQQQLITKAKEIEKNFKTIKQQFEKIGAIPKTMAPKKETTEATNIESNIEVNKPKRPKMKSFC
ncbi:hypothetical protein [Shewanella surugensis]|uniref:Uncharacterized protein n=1 Tax=Shewanella surugensis TaxID=212020 RepID=A0ABT0L8N1_9GAMM|nr:hypothetical protein [Shewanella surugensis]MCL1123702.1 hypothetical protein [Shewanella surugensis]